MFTEKTKYVPVYRVTTARRVFYTNSASRAERIASRYASSAIWERVDKCWQRIA
jgi:hypothetical protein